MDAPTNWFEDWLATKLPSTRAMVERLRAIDPAYGSQSHQRAFCDFMDHLQRSYPCAADHEHRGDCYKAEQVKQARQSFGRLDLVER